MSNPRGFNETMEQYRARLKADAQRERERRQGSHFFISRNGAIAMTYRKQRAAEVSAK